MPNIGTSPLEKVVLSMSNGNAGKIQRNKIEKEVSII
jgi:hypothetical protein